MIDVFFGDVVCVEVVFEYVNMIVIEVVDDWVICIWFVEVG